MTSLHGGLDEIRMAVSYLRRGMTGQATFSLFARELPPDRGFVVSAGLDECLAFLEKFAFGEGELGYLRTEVGLTWADLEALAPLRFEGEVWAAPEGRLMFAGEPLLEVTAALPVAKLVGSALLNFVSFSSAVATGAARCRIAAGGADLIDFAAQRVHSASTAHAVARSTALAGFAGTTHLSAAREFGLRPVGTMDPSFVLAFGAEQPAFRAFAEDFPQGLGFLVDESDATEGVRTLIEVVRTLGLAEDKVGLRLEAGNVLTASRQVRDLLDRAGLTHARIMAAGGLDEYELAMLRDSGAPIDSFGVGTEGVLSADVPFLDCAYELVEYDGTPSRPGRIVPWAKQVHRTASGEQDTLARRDEPVPAAHRAVLEPVMRNGRRVRGKHGLADARMRFERDLRWLPRHARRLREPEPVPVRYSDGLAEPVAQPGAG
ncbi:nicotinate phosphoribosyltransferase [Amycolatopsis acidicola]|uniref:Nicotinate phosphoribosyltransferase n=1 Tax=Amycolatopsis acidicola TaxID=2596893 RepID=A0A5N0US08_9PSEU|nr:nicotinate phosphoribosyltransferase [Amycolatopsis acidicola]KAA9152160.1 nicotinate phosphoribosyltransferase [Amycolatopsis acidicola]